jgi:hypothetical protein
LKLGQYSLHEISLIIENYKKFFADVTRKQDVGKWRAFRRMVV